MNKYSFSISNVEMFEAENYDKDEFGIVHLDFLGTNPNSHQLEISEEVLKKYANTILGKWIVADMTKIIDCGSHSPLEKIVGYIPETQDIKFTRNSDGYLRANCVGIISKIYAQDFCEVFMNTNTKRSVSVEMLTAGEEFNQNKLVALNIVGVTVLGLKIKPSSPGSEINFTRFSEKEKIEEKYCNIIQKMSDNNLSELKKFAKERRVNMEKKTYKVDKSKDSMVDTPWGEVDKTELYKKIIDASNADTLVKDVYMKVENGWKDAPSDKLKYPVMQFKGDTLVYNRNGLGSALGYAKAENETDVVSKIEKIYKSLDIEDDNDNKESKGKESKTMQEQKFEIEGRKAWGDVITKVQDHEGKDAYVDSVEKDHIIYTKGDERYRVEADVKVSKDDKKVSADIKWDTVKKDKVQKMEEKTDDEHDDDDHDDEHKEKTKMEEKQDKTITMSECVNFIKKLSTDANVDASAYCEMLEREAEKNAKLAKDLEDKDNIIMQKDTELGELRKFKEDTEKKSVEMEVAKTLEEVKNFVDKDEFEKFECEGKLCKMSELDGWKNKVKSVAFEASKKSNKSRQGLWRMGSPVETNKNTGLWAD